ncbi:DUF397 domain-containing protein [Streptomyces sp. NPDC087226]
MTHPLTEHCGSLEWFKSSYGSADGPGCAEVAFAPRQWVAFAPYVSGSR